MTYSVQHTKLGQRPYWYQLEACAHPATAMWRARQYALDNGGYVCVMDKAGCVVFGTDPIELDKAIAQGANRDFTEIAA